MTDPSPRSMNMTSCCSTGLRGGAPMSAPTVPLQEATILDYARRLQLPTLGRQFARLAEESARQNQTNLDYLEILLESEVEERERNTLPGVSMRPLPEGENTRGVRLPKGAAYAGCVIRNLSEEAISSKASPYCAWRGGNWKDPSGDRLAVAACRQRKRVRFYHGGLADKRTHRSQKPK